MGPQHFQWAHRLPFSMTGGVFSMTCVDAVKRGRSVVQRALIARLNSPRRPAQGAELGGCRMAPTVARVLQ